MKKSVLLFFLAMLCSALAWSQTRTITGRVTNSSGNPVAFANITVKGTKGGTVADANGNFSISAKTGDILVVSAVENQTQEIKITDASNISIVLVPGTGVMNEVVVTALGISRSKNQLPYAAQKISGNDVSQNRGNNFINSLSGKASGLEIRQTNTMGGSTNVVLRGSKSLTRSNQALFVIDGVPIANTNSNTLTQSVGGGGFDYGNAAADINPDDIESVTVLKGAAATALYGWQGSNGVILITTKKGKRGLGITINAGVTTGQYIKSTFTTYQKKYGEGYGKYYSSSTNPYFEGADLNGDGIEDLVAPTTEDASYGNPFDPSLLVYQWNAFDPSSPNYGKATPWVAAQNDPTTFFTNPTSYNTSVFLEAGGDKGTFALGYTRNSEEGIIPNSKLIKNLINFSSTYKINDALTAGASINYSRIDGKGRYGTGYDGANALNPMTNFRQWWGVNNDVQELKTAYFNTGRNVTWNWSNPFELGFSAPLYWDNPYFSRYENVETDFRNRYNGNVSLTYKPLKWLNVVGRTSVDSYDQQFEERKAVGSVGVPYYRKYNETYRQVNYDLIANGDLDITSDLSFKPLLGGTINEIYLATNDAATNGGLVVPKLYTLANSLNTPSAPIETQGKQRIESGYGGASFSYKETYILDGTLRVDRASTLPKNNNVYAYYGISGGIVFSKFLENLSWLNYGKIRANYATVGAPPPIYFTQDAYVNDLDFNSGLPVTSFNGNALFSVSGTKANDDLKPERTKSFETGIEASILKSRAGFDITYYDAKTVDQILPVSVSTATGYTRKIVNSGTIRNSGIELSVYGTPIKTKNFSWDVSLNWTRNRNKVLELYEGVDNIVLGSFQGSITINASLNEPYGTIHGTDFVYDSATGQKVVGSNGRYLKTSTNNVTIGNINPDWIGGITNKFTYKQFAFSFLIDIKHGGDVFSTDLYYGLATGLYPETAGNNDLGNPIRNTIADGGGILREGVDENGKPNSVRAEAYNFGAYGYRYSPDKAFVYDAGYVKLRDASITYSLPATLFKNGALKGIDVSLIGHNLWIIHKNLPYADPEEGFGSGNLQGIQTGAYPTVRTIGFNVKMKF